LGFDLDPFLNAHAHQSEFRRELGFADHHKLIGIVGRIFPIKNHTLFLDAAAWIAARDSAARFVIVGDGVLRRSLENQARELGIGDQVLFTGWRSDLPRICADLNVLVVSSDNEGTPVSAIEAMAAGCPVVATRVGGLPDLIEDQKTGRLVPSRDADALASAVLDLLQSPHTARELGRNAQEFVRQRFTVRRLLGDMDHLYSQLLAEKAITFREPEKLVGSGVI
jgi:glycosyltransferase involved in cell wall biosynthesis